MLPISLLDFSNSAIATKKKSKAGLFIKIGLFILIPLVLSTCSNKDPNYQLSDPSTWHAPFSLRTYDDYMTAAHEAMAKGNTQEAIAMFHKAVDTAKSEYGQKDLRIATSASYLASLYMSIGLLGEAEIYYRKAYTVDKASLGPDHPETIRMRQALSDVLIKLFKVDEANKLLHNPQAASQGIIRKP